jgi:hypothetical protein
MRTVLLSSTLALALACSETGLNTQVPVADPTESIEEQAPAILVEPPALDFGKVQRGNQEVRTLTVTNVGTAPLDLLEILPPDSEFVAMSPLTTRTLTPGASTGLSVVWRPLAYIDLDDVLGIEHTVHQTPRVDVPMTGVVAAPAIVLTPEYHDFGTIPRNVTTDLVVQVANEGEDSLWIHDFTYTSTSDTELFLHDATALTPLPFTLDAGDAVDVVVRFRPTAELMHEGTLTVLSDDPRVPEATATQVGTGAPRDGYELLISVSADDEWEGWFDGVPLSGENLANWQRPDDFEWTLGPGTYVLGLRSWDKFRVVAALISFVKVDGEVLHRSGDGTYRLSTVEPADGWLDADFDASDWPEAAICAPGDASVWGTYWPEPFYAAGAQWIWHSTNCRTFGEAWYRLVIELP